MEIQLDNVKHFGVIVPVGNGIFGFEFVLNDDSNLLCYTKSELSLKNWIYEIDWRHDAVNRLFNTTNVTLK